MSEHGDGSSSEEAAAFPDHGAEQAQRALADATRRVIEEVRTTRAPAAVIEAARQSLLEAARILAPHRHEGGHAQAHLLGGFGRFGQTDDPMEYFPYSPFIGRGNPLALPVVFTVVDGTVRGRATFTPAYCGPPNHVHGGVVAAVFDELLGTVNVVNGLGAMTGTLTVRYRKPTPLLAEITMEGRPAGSSGRKVFAEGTMWHGETLLAEAEGVFIRVTEPLRDKLIGPGA